MELLEKRNKYEKIFSDKIFLKQPVLISPILPQKVLDNIVSKTEQLKFFSPILLKLKVKNDFLNVFKERVYIQQILKQVFNLIQR